MVRALFTRFACAVLLLVISHGVIASELGSASFAPQMHRYSTSDGLPSNRVWAVVQDRMGYVWVATDRGLVVFNGRSFERPRLDTPFPELAVESLYLDSLDQLWLGASERGVCVIASNRQRYQCFASESTPRHKLPGDTVFAITEFNHSIFLGVFEYGIVEIDPKQWVVRQSWPLARADFIGAASSEKHAVFAHFSGGFATLAPTSAGWSLEESSEPTGKLTFLTNRQNRLWLGRGGGLGAALASFDKGTWTTEEILRVPASVLAIELLNNKVYAGSTVGLSEGPSDPPRILSATFGQSHGMPEGDITALWADSRAGLWIGSDGDGLAYWSKAEQQRDWLLRSSPGLPTALIQHAIRARDGGYWLATQNRGVLKLELDGRLTDVPVDRNASGALPTSSTRVLLERSGKDGEVLWIGHQLGVTAYTPKQKHFRHWQAQTDSKLVDLLIGDPIEGVWLVSGRDTLVHLNAQLQPLFQSDQALTGGELEQIQWLDEHLWLAGQGGLRELGPTSAGLTLLSTVIEEPVYAFTRCKDSLWLATSSQLLRLDFKTRRQQEAFARAKGGLPTDIGGMHCSEGGELWWAGPGGLWHLHGATPKAVYFPGANIEFSARPFVIDQTQMLIGSQSGLLRQTIDLPVSGSENYPLHLRLNGSPTSSEVLALPWRNPTLDLQLDALNFGAGQTQFRFQLTPGPEATLTTNPSFRLTSLAPGAYELRASAQSGGTEQFARPLRFVVPPPPWQRWYVQLAVLLLLLALSAWLSALYLRARSAKRTQLQRIAHAEQLDRARLESVAFISHEMRNVLNGITANAELLRQSDSPGEQALYRSRILDSGAALTQLLDDALDHSKLQLKRLTLHSQVFRLRELMQSLADEYGEKSRVNGLQWYAVCDVPDCAYSDPLRLRQIATNLLSNAIKFTTNGSVRFYAHWHDQQLTLRVQDTGPGISPDKQAELFTPFARLDRREQGSGLGLALSFQLARAMGGNLLLERAYTQGCEFVLYLPMPSAEAEEGKASVGVRPLSLLIVEDQAENRALLEELLSRVGHRVTAVADAFSALSMTTNERFDAVLIDLDLGALSGWELAPLLQAQPGYAAVPLIALSGRVEAVHRTASREAGMVAHLAKPYQLDQIQATLAEHCHAQAPADN